MSKSTMSASNLKDKTLQVKRDTIQMCSKTPGCRIASCFSTAEMLVMLYYNVLNVRPGEPEWQGRDRFILSKGHASPILYCILADMGFFPKSWCGKLDASDAPFGVLLQNTVPGVEISTGSLGHGLGVACGIAYGLKLKRELPLTWVLMGDAECYEGSVWESAAFASHNHLNNLVVLLDRNYLGATDFTENMCALENLEEKWGAFGWDTTRINGHSFEELHDALWNIRGRRSRQPHIIICDTIKGNGLSCMENKPPWHYIAPSGELAQQAKEMLS